MRPPRRWRAVLPGGKPARGAVITVQDPGAAPGADRWTAIAGDGGQFEFLGLSENIPLRLSARANAGGRAYISGKHRVEPGETEWVIALKSEDPTMPGRRKR